MPTVAARFLLARFAAMLAGFCLVVGSFGTFNAFADHIGSGVLRWLTGAAVLIVGLWLAYTLNSAVIHRVDPDGAQRDALRARRTQPDPSRR